MLETLNRDGSNGEPYVNHLAGHHSELAASVLMRDPDNHASKSRKSKRD
jgi:hypothetical protein